MVKKTLDINERKDMVSTMLVTYTDIEEERVKLLGIFVKRMFTAKGVPKGNWRGMSCIGIGNSVILTVNDIMAHSLEELKADLTPEEKVLYERSNNS
jgi:hypothetical protein